MGIYGGLDVCGEIGVNPATVSLSWNGCGHIAADVQLQDCNDGDGEVAQVEAVQAATAVGTEGAHGEPHSTSCSLALWQRCPPSERRGSRATLHCRGWHVMSEVPEGAAAEGQRLRGWISRNDSKKSLALAARAISGRL